MNNYSSDEAWTDEEREIVLEHAGKTIAREIANMLFKKGYPQRSPCAVRGIIRRNKGQRKRNPLPLPTRKPEPLKPMQKQPAMAVTSKAKIMYFDIEATDLSAGFGEMICFGYWWHHEAEPRVLNMWDYPGWDKLPTEQRDLYLLQDVVKLMEEADVLVGHFSTGFDHPFIQTRCLFHGLDPIPNPIHIDTWKIAKKQLRLNNNRLKTIAKALQCDEQKAEVPLYVWRRAKAHDVDAMKIISAYNLQDVRTQRSVTERLMPLAKGMPNWNLLTNDTKARCPACGSDSLQHRGYAYTKMFKYRRLRCNNCGKWMRERNTITPVKTTRIVS